MRLDKPIGILLLLWPTLWALLMASKRFPDLKLLTIFIGGAILMRSAGCVINDYLDRKIDPQVQRTKSRQIVLGNVTLKEVLVIVLGLCLSSFKYFVAKRLAPEPFLLRHGRAVLMRPGPP